MRDIIKELHDKVQDDLTEVDVDTLYDEMLNECYSMSSVGGPFSHMMPSKVLEECDPVAYRCGFSDWLDSENLYEFGSGNFYLRDLERVKDALIDELQDEIDDLEGQLEDLDPSEAENIEECDSLGSEIAELEELITTLRKYSF
jgi:hypothetical protein